MKIQKKDEIQHGRGGEYKSYERNEHRQEMNMWEYGDKRKWTMREISCTTEKGGLRDM